MRTAIATDSNSGITQEQAAKLGIYVLPMPFMINGEMFYEGVNLTHEEFFKRMEEGADITTSQPSPGEVTDFWDKLLKEYDEILYIPMSSGLSGSCQTAIMLADDYDGKVQVVNNQRISVTQEQSALDARDLAAKGYEAAQIKEILERTKYESSIYITLTTLKYLKKGGRITPAAAALGTLLRIKPVLTIQGEKLDAFSKARTAKQAKTIMLTALAKDLEERFHDKNAEHTYLEIAHTCNEEGAKELEEALKEQYPGAPITIAPLSLSIACHPKHSPQPLSVKHIVFRYVVVTHILFLQFRCTVWTTNCFNWDHALAIRTLFLCRCLWCFRSFSNFFQFVDSFDNHKYNKSHQYKVDRLRDKCTVINSCCHFIGCCQCRIFVSIKSNEHV